MDIDHAETRRATRRLAQLYDDLVVRAVVGEPDTGASPDSSPDSSPDNGSDNGPDRGPGDAGDLSTVGLEATRLASRLARLGGALEGFSQEARNVDDAQAHRLAGLAAAARGVR